MRNHVAETNAENDFNALQDRIFSCFGTATPKPPVLRCRNATQTSVVLEWDTIDLATADLLSLSLYRNGQKAGAIPRPLEMHSTKISGLSIDTDYTFHLILRTTAGTYASERVTVRTHKMTDLSGITITTGILPAPARDALTHAVERIGAKIVDGVRIDTTHFVTTEGRGLAWEKAVEMNIPVVRPEWVDACERTGRILGVTKFYLDAMRPGPGDFGMNNHIENNSTAINQGTSVPPSESQHQKKQSKDLPQVPSQEASNGEAAGSTSSPKENGDRESTRNSNEKTLSAADEQKAQVPDPDEQKVRLEESDMPIRPANSQSNISVGEGAISDVSENEVDNVDRKTATSPGDGSSFQDVAL